MTIYDTSRPKTQGRKPNQGTRERQRRRKLESILPDVRAVLDHASAEARETFRDRVAPLVALAVAELAVLDRQTDAAEPAVIRQYGKILADALDLHAEPWRAVALWKDAATGPLKAFGKRWADYLVRAERDSEGKYHHDKLVNLDAVSVALSLTRARIASIFGDRECSLPPVRMTERTFTLEEQRDIRALAKRIGLTAQHIRDIALDLDPVAFCDRMLTLELVILPGMDKYRSALGSDASVSRSVKRFLTPKKPGPKPKPNGRTAQIAALAWHRRVSADTIKRLLADLRAPIETPETGENPVTLHLNSCHTAPEFDAVRLPDFEPLPKPKTQDSPVTLRGVTITEPDLLALASLPWTEGPRARSKRKVQDYSDRDLIVSWWEATRGVTPTPAQIRKWAQRGYLTGYGNSARLWREEMDIRAREDAEEAERIASAPVITPTIQAPSAGPVSGTVEVPPVLSLPGIIRVAPPPASVAA